MKIIIIAAVSKNNVIGKDGQVPWHSKNELEHFKKSTMGFPVVMGRKTWESIGKPLNGRLNIVISRNKEFQIPFKEVIIFYSLQEAISFLKTSVYEKSFIIGGAEIFKEGLNTADELILSEMNFEAEGNVYFPEVDGEIWVQNSSEIFTDFIVHHYIRREDLKD